MTEESLTSNERRFLGFVLGIIVIFVCADLLNDYSEGVPFGHLSLEFAVALAAAIGFFILMKDSIRKSHQLIQSKSVILEKEAEVAIWKAESQKFTQGLSDAIDAQLARWNLSPSEKEVALLILKGLSLKEIAEVRKTAEKTVRAQCVAVYSKSGLSGRSELAAFFLEDLLLPQTRSGG